MILAISTGSYAWGASDFNTDPPASPTKLIFIHHSTGENWLADSDGGLGIALRDNNHFVSDTNYGWGPGGIGDLTDIGHWWNWFRGSGSATYLAALYSENDRSEDFYSRLSTDPGGENEIVMFKSCFPNSNLEGKPDDPPTAADNPLRGEDSSSDNMTVGNAKGIYNDILVYFTTRQDKLFIAVTAPPLAEAETDTLRAANARAFNNWLVNDWLGGYPHNNVAVFDFYNILTSNGGDHNTNDAGQETGNHHRWWNHSIQHIQTVSRDTSAYPSDEWDSHPTIAGNQKATAEFINLLNIYYHCWKGTGACPGTGLTVIYVDPTASCGGNTPCYSTIQAAIDAASTGATIRIAQGSYNEDLTFAASKSLTIQGGWNSSFTSRLSDSTVKSMTISNGCVITEYILIQ